MKKYLFLILAIGLFIPSLSFAAPSIVQSCEDQHYVSSPTCTLLGNMGSGNTIVAISYAGATGDIFTITGSGCSNWVSVFTSTSTQGASWNVWTATSTNGVSCSASTTENPNNNWNFLNMMEISGTKGALDGAPAINHPSFCATCSSAGLTTVTNGDLILPVLQDASQYETYSNFSNGFIIFAQGTSTAHGQGSGSYANAYLVQSTAGNVSTTWQITAGSSVDDSVIMAFQPLDLTPPSVSWISPSSNAIASSTIILTASSSDNVAVSSTAFYYGSFGGTFASSTPIGSTSTASGTLYSFPWNTSSLTNGSTTLWALATDTSNNTSTASTTVNVENPPSVPASVIATAASPTEIDLTWASSTGHGGTLSYTISRGGAQVATTTSLSYADTGLSPSTSYTYLIKSVDGAGNVSASSSPATATTQSSAPPPAPVIVSVAAGYLVGLPPGYILNPTSTTSTSTLSGIASNASIETLILSLQAKLQTLIAEAGQAGTSPISPSLYSFTRNLELHDQGSDVQALQMFLIQKNAGPAAQALAAHGATGHFGILTLRALEEYQTSVGLPATGYFGPKTRGYITTQPIQ